MSARDQWSVQSDRQAAALTGDFNPYWIDSWLLNGPLFQNCADACAQVGFCAGMVNVAQQ